MNALRSSLRVLTFIGGVFALPAAYIFSYAPMQHFRSIAATANPPADTDSWMRLYQPVEWMIDETPLSNSLLKWAEFNHVERLVENDMQLRNLERRLAK